jgi:putative hydrolase of the HAD superfamily
MRRALLFDWGDTLMRVFPQAAGPMAAWPQVEAVPEAAAALAALQPTWTLAVATNATESAEAEIRAALARVELDHFFERIYCFRTLGRQKPDPVYFTAILADLELPPERVVMVGDSFTADVAGAVQCGLAAVWFNPRTPEVREGPGLATIHDLSELPAALAGLGFAPHEPPDLEDRHDDSG